MAVLITSDVRLEFEVKLIPSLLKGMHYTPALNSSLFYDHLNQLLQLSVVRTAGEQSDTLRFAWQSWFIVQTPFRNVNR